MKPSFVAILFMTLSSFMMESQNLTINSFELYRGNNLAVDSVRYDLNNDITSAIIVEGIDFSDVLFKGNIIGLPLISQYQTVLYLTDGTRKLNLYKQNFLPLEINFTDYEFTKLGLEGGKTYYLRIEAPTAKIKVENGSNILLFKSTEKMKIILVNGDEWPLSQDGKSAKRLMPFGIYEYTAISETGESVTGKVNVENTFGNIIIKINFE